MEEEKLTPDTDPVLTEEVEEKKETPTLDTINDKLDSIVKENERLKKQNSDKDSHISRIESENKGFRLQVEKVSQSLEGKTEVQKDALLEKHRGSFLEMGYDSKSVDLLLGKISAIAEEKARFITDALIADSALGLIESDSEIDRTFLGTNEQAIMQEYHSYKQEVTPRRIKANLKKAYNHVKGQLAKEGQGTKDGRREEMIEGARPPEKGKKGKDSEQDFITSIEKAGHQNSHFI